jgi:hypothetical protein
VINISTLSKKDIGRWVLYKTDYEKEIGRVKDYNDKYIFVVYKCNNEWNNFFNYTGCATDPTYLEIIEHDKLYCTCGEMATGVQFNDYYLVSCAKCESNIKYERKRKAYLSAYIILSPKSLVGEGHIEMMSNCSHCKEPHYHNFKYVFCKKCKTILRKYK